MYYLLHIRLRSNTAADSLLMRYFTAAKQSDGFYVKAFDPFPASLSLIQNFYSSTMDEWRNRTICVLWNANFISWKHRML